MRKFLVMLLAMLTLGAVSVFASSPTDFATALPASLIPSGFWTLASLVFGVIVTIGGIVIGVKLMKRARG